MIGFVQKQSFGFFSFLFLLVDSELFIIYPELLRVEK